MTMKIESPAFAGGGRIPAGFTCSGADISPALKWTAPPEGTVELVLIMDDPDAPMGTWTHWILYGLDPATRELPEGVSKGTTAPEIGAKQGITSFGRPGYGGPCPPPGPDHRYFFKLHALDTATNLPAGASLREVEHAIRGHIIAEAQLMGTFSR